MIELKNVSKSFNGVKVLNNINLSFPQYGIVVIYGPSGCGKSTLLNIISSLCDFEGDISYNGKLYKNLSEEDKDNLRNSKIGFVFQDYKLYEFETVKNNIMLSLDIKSDEKEELKQRRVIDLLNIVGLNNKKDEKVTNLSGGEKQRIAIARAIANSPNLLLCDEPTGNLDPKNSKVVMDLLERVSKSSLVIVVSHDQELTKEYADEIIYLKDGEVKKVEYNNHNRHVDRLPLLHIKQKEKKAKLPFSFSIRHIFNSLKRRKWRTLLILLSTSLSLIGVGLGVVLTDLISTNMYKSYSSIIDTNKVIVKSKDNNVSSKIYSSALEEVELIRDKYENDVNLIGVNYLNNLYTMFPESYIGLSSGKSTPFYSLNSVNEFMRIDEIKTTIYPSPLTAIQDNEVILGLSNSTLVDLCLHFQISRTAESLGNHIKKNDIYLNVDVSNNAWQYDRSFSLKVVGISIANANVLIHSNPLWNEFVLETLCGLPSTNIAFLASRNPWDLRKTYYLEMKKNKDNFLKKMKFDMDNREYIAEVINDNYYKIRDKGNAPKDYNRIMIFNSEQKDNVDAFIGDYISNISSSISSYTYGSSGSLVMYPENLMMGFARSTYLYFDQAYGQEVVDLTSYIKYEEANNINVPEEVIEGHYTKSVNNGLTFSPSYSLISGRKPNNYNEIVVSQQIVNRFKIYNPLNKHLYFSFPVIEELLPSGYLSRTYHTVRLEIVGITGSNRYEISHDKEWPIIFFQSHVGVSIFSLTVDNLSLDINEKEQDAVINKINRAFPSLEATCPINNVKDSVTKVCNYIQVILLILSASSVLIAGLLLTMCNLLHYNEIKKDIGLARCLGISKKEGEKFIFYHSLSLGFISFVISSIEVLVLCLVLSKAMGEIFMIETSFYFNPLAILYMFGLSLIIALFSSLVIKKKIDGLNPLDCLR